MKTKTLSVFQSAIILLAKCFKNSHPMKVSEIMVSPYRLELKCGKTRQLTASIIPENVQGKTIIWSSSKNTVATVDATGKVTAIAAGKTTITAKTGERTATCSITVKPLNTTIPKIIDMVNLADTAAVKAEIDNALAAGYKAFKIIGAFSKLGINTSWWNPTANPFAGTNVEMIDLTGVTGWPEVDTNDDNIPAGTRGVPAYAFVGWVGIGSTFYYKALKEIRLPAEVKAVGANAFFWNKQLALINLENIEAVGQQAFSCCNSLTVITFNHARVINKSAFENCAALREVTIKNRITNAATIRENAFASCCKLEKIYAPAVKSIENAAFSNCTSLSNLMLDNTTEIGHAVFRKTGLTSIKLNKVKTIRTGTFTNCTTLTNIILNPATIIEEKAFLGCSALNVFDLPQKHNNIQVLYRE